MAEAGASSATRSTPSVTASEAETNAVTAALRAARAATHAASGLAWLQGLSLEARLARTAEAALAAALSLRSWQAASRRPSTCDQTAGAGRSRCRRGRRGGVERKPADSSCDSGVDVENSHGGRDQMPAHFVENGRGDIQSMVIGSPAEVSRAGVGHVPDAKADEARDLSNEVMEVDAVNEYFGVETASVGVCTPQPLTESRTVQTEYVVCPVLCSDLGLWAEAIVAAEFVDVYAADLTDGDNLVPTSTEKLVVAPSEMDAAVVPVANQAQGQERQRKQRSLRAHPSESMAASESEMPMSAACPCGSRMEGENRLSSFAVPSEEQGKQRAQRWSDVNSETGSDSFVKAGRGSDVCGARQEYLATCEQDDLVRDSEQRSVATTEPMIDSPEPMLEGSMLDHPNKDKINAVLEELAKIADQQRWGNAGEMARSMLL